MMLGLKITIIRKEGVKMMNIKRILFIFFTLLFLCSCGENKNDKKTDISATTTVEAKKQDETETDDYVSDEKLDETISFPKNTKEIEDFLPKNWKIIYKVDGDLNNDKLNDVVIIIEDTNPKNIVNNDNLGPENLNLNERIILVLFQEKDGSYTLKSKNDKGFIESENSKENPALTDPLQDGDINIVNNTLRIEFNYWYSAGTWYTSSVEYIFRYQNNQFELIGFEENSYHRASGEMSTYSYNLSTGKIKIVTGDNMFEENESKPEVEWKEKVINPKPILDKLDEDALNELLSLTE